MRIRGFQAQTNSMTGYPDGFSREDDLACRVNKMRPNVTAGRGGTLQLAVELHLLLLQPLDPLLEDALPAAPVRLRPPLRRVQAAAVREGAVRGVGEPHEGQVLPREPGVGDRRPQILWGREGGGSTAGVSHSTPPHTQHAHTLNTPTHCLQATPNTPRQTTSPKFFQGLNSQNLRPRRLIQTIL